MNKIKIFLILFVLLFSIGVVSAEGNFTALQDEIDASGDSMEITQDYVYDNTTDNSLKNGILIEKSDFTINGNGYTINGGGHARIFNITGNNVTILNLKLINGNSYDGAAIYSSSSITLNKVSCINNNATRGAIFGNVGSQIIRDCYFENNTGIYAGSIYYDFTAVHIINSTFTNTTSKYAPAIYHQSHAEFTVQDCTFKNLYAEQGSGGAIGIKDIGVFEVDNCTFINTTSYKNGGAIFLDFVNFGQVYIRKSRFFNSTGNFGGALAILGGYLILEDCEFYDNAATYAGGAIYHTQAIDLKIINTLFYRNKLLYDDSCGGAIYIDTIDTASIENCEFINNSRQGIYSYDCDENSGLMLNVKDTKFLNNGEAIHTVFSSCNMTNITIGNDTLCLNDTNYVSNVHEIAKSITLINNTIDVVTLPSKYDSRDWGWVSPVKDQGTMGSCWTFGNCGALESALLKATGIEYDFSENNMQDSMLKYSKYGIKDATEGGVIKEQGLEYILSWFGVMPSEYDIYDELGKLSPLIFGNEKIHIFDAIFIGSRKNFTDNDELKRAIMRCGSVAAGFYYDNMDDTIYNKENGACYQTEYNYTDHMVSIVGWDDNYPKENFVMTPPGDGAFIVKNSHGTEMGDKGFLYLSYYDPSLLNGTIAIGYLIENTENYTTNYQTDLGGHRDIVTKDGNILRYKNTYEASYGPELISAVGTYFEADENYTLEIYVNDELVHIQSGISPFYGYHTVKLTTEIPITTGDNFTALMKKSSISLFSKSRQHYKENVSFIDMGDEWIDLALNFATVSLKVYTKALAIYTQDLVKIYKNDTQFEAYVCADNEIVTFEINGETYNRTSNEEGIAKMTINLGPGNYTIKTTFNGTTVENTIEVLPTLIGENLVKYFRNGSQFYVGLIDDAGNPVAGVNITMNINGVFYNRTTNENGTAKLNINLMPGEYILTAIDPLTGLQMSYNITVLPTLSAEDLNMKYLDESKFETKLVDGQGKAMANKQITFNINGVLYQRTTDENGIARLNIRLMAGEYIITSQYEQAMISNKITISV